MMISAYQGPTITKNEFFEEHGFLMVKNLWDAEELYHPLPSIRGKLEYVDRSPDHFNHLPVEDQVPGALARYWHPQYRMIHSGIRGRIEEVLGDSLYNTYYYDRFYFPGQELVKHKDRDACEISVTVHCSTNLPDNKKYWPICVETPSGDIGEITLEPGDGLIYKGCERFHWRDPMPSPRRKLFGKNPEYYYHQIFFHYVLQNGYRTHFAGDNNPGVTQLEVEVNK